MHSLERIGKLNTIEWYTRNRLEKYQKSDLTWSGLIVSDNNVNHQLEETRILTHFSKMPQIGSVLCAIVQDTGEMTVLK